MIRFGNVSVVREEPLCNPCNRHNWHANGRSDGRTILPPIRLGGGRGGFRRATAEPGAVRDVRASARADVCRSSLGKCELLKKPLTEETSGGSFRERSMRYAARIL